MAALRELMDGIVLRWPTPASRLWLRKFLREASSDENVLAIVVVGSTIRRRVESDDLDLVILCEDRTQFRYKSPIEVDLRTFAISTADDELSHGHELLGWAVKFGSPIFDRRDTWRKLASRWRDRLPLPDPVRARRRAATALRHFNVLQEVGDQAAAAEIRLSHVTLLARAALAEAGVYPASRPELPGQLRAIGRAELAKEVEDAILERRRIASEHSGLPPSSPLHPTARSARGS